MALADIVNVSITANTVVPSRTGFGTPLILGYHTRFAERARTYKTTLAMIADGFVTSDPEYRMAQKIFAQNPKVKQVIVGRMANAPTMSVVLTPVVQDLVDYTVTLNGVDYTYTSAGGATAAAIVAGLVAAIGSVGGVTATDTGNTHTTVTLTGTAGALFTMTVDRHFLTRHDTTADPGTGIVADLAAIELVNNTFYSVHPTLHGGPVAVNLAAQIETEHKLLITESGDDAELAGTGIGADLHAAGYARTVLVYTSNPDSYPGAAWAGKVLPQDPGSATWKFKTLAGIVADTLTDTEIGFLEGKDVNYYVEVAGVSITQQGVSASGEFIDITQGIDWLSSILQEDIFALLANSKKVPFTDPGIQAVEAIVRGDLNRAIGVGFLAADPAPVVTVPLASEVSAADKAARLLPDIEFQGTLAGAIHAVEINGTVSV